MMLPVKGWRIFYADESTFTSEDGTWAEAPPFGVQMIVWYHDPPYKTLYQGEPEHDAATGWLRRAASRMLGHSPARHRGNDIYIYKGEGDYEGLKMGMWMDDVGLHRIHDLASASTMPKPDQ